MKSGFSDPIAIKQGKKIKSPFNFDAPPYDERSSCYVKAGTDYGVGHKQPVGHKGNPKKDVPTLPKHYVKGMESDYVNRNGKISNVEVDEKE